MEIMTFNLRYQNMNDPEFHLWEDRLPRIKNLIEHRKPDVIGTQEGLYRQIVSSIKLFQTIAGLALAGKAGARVNSARFLSYFCG